MTELIGRYKQGPELLLSVLEGITDEEASFHHVPGKWNIKQYLRHLADTEIVAGARFRQMLAEDNPPMNAFKEAVWADKLDYTSAPVAESMAVFTVLRRDNADTLAKAGEAGLSRTGQHSVRGPMTVQALVELFVTHVEKHAGHITAIRDAWKAR